MLPGEQQRSCSLCGACETGEIPATGEHTFGEWVNGIRSCSVCGETEEERINPFIDKWYTAGILYCYYNGYMAGTSENVFSYKVLLLFILLGFLLLIFR